MNKHSKKLTEVVEQIAEALARHQTPVPIAERLLATATQFASDDPVLAMVEAKCAIGSRLRAGTCHARGTAR